VFTTLIVQPIFNLLVLIYNLIPGHNFGLAIIIFTIVIRMALYPLVKRQLHQTKLMRRLQPELKLIKKAAKGDRQKESVMTMELYKERGVSIFASLKVALIQLPILFGLYLGLNKLLKDQHQIVTFAYPWLQHFSWMEELSKNIHKFDTTLFHVVELTRPALTNKGVYWPAMLLVAGSAIIQFLQSRQLMPQPKDSKSLRQILRSAGDGKSADQSEVNAAVGRSTIFILPIFVFIFTVRLPSALSLYWLVGGLVAFAQQSVVLKDDVTEMEAQTPAKPTKTSNSKTATDKNLVEKTILEGEVVSPIKNTKKTASSKKNSSKNAKSKSRRR
jgi:YidC/Oxa1 family membrane protein insertase